MSLPLLVALPEITASRLVRAIERYQRQLRADGLSEADDLNLIRRALLSAHGGQAGTTFDAPVDPLNGGSVPDGSRLLTYPEVSGRLGVGERTVKRLVSDGCLQVVHIGTAARVHTDDLETYMNSLREGTA